VCTRLDLPDPLCGQNQCYPPLLSYRYRDASNYKANGAVLLYGDATPDLHRRLRENLIDNEYFIPEKVGIPALRDKLYPYSGGRPIDDDHLLHEFVELRKATSQEVASMTPIGEVEEVVMRFETRAKESGGWWQGIAELLLDLGLPGV